MTPQQLSVLKSYIDASPDLSVFPNNEDGWNDILPLLNAEASPPFVVYRTSCATAEVGNTVNYIAVEAMTDANRGRITTFYSMNPSQFNPSRADVRSYWANTFSGALGGQGQATRDALDALWKRNATRVEKLFATGTGTTASPGGLVFEGNVSADDVRQARALP